MFEQLNVTSFKLDISASKSFFNRRTEPTLTVLLLKEALDAEMSRSIDLLPATFNHSMEAHFVIVTAQLRTPSSSSPRCASLMHTLYTRAHTANTDCRSTYTHTCIELARHTHSMQLDI